MEYDIINESEAIGRIGDKDFLAELLQDFNQMPELDLGLITEYIVKNDIDSVELVSHTLKGASGNLALTAICVVATALNNAAGQKNMELIKKHFEALKYEVERFRAWLPLYLDSLQD